MTEEAQELTMSRVFDAPRELVYKAFTDEDQLARWFGPVGWSVPRESVSVDARAGGHQRFTMVNDDDPTMSSPVNATFTEVIENELLVGHEFVDNIPGTTTTVEFSVRLEFHDAGEGKTRLELRQGPYSAEMEGNAREGWGSSFIKLDALLAS
jgi:uncharacterized protein YndB with AHSA1/START domain